MTLLHFHRNKKEASASAPSKFSVFWNKHFQKDRQHDFELHGLSGKERAVYRGRKAKKYLKKSLSYAMELNGHLAQTTRSAKILSVIESSASPECKETQYVGHWQVLEKDMQGYCNATTDLLNGKLKGQPPEVIGKFLSPARQVTRMYSHHSRGCWVRLNIGMYGMMKGIEKKDGAQLEIARAVVKEGVDEVRKTFLLLESLKHGDLLLMRDIITCSDLLERKKIQPA